jgi:hypothetical protein
VCKIQIFSHKKVGVIGHNGVIVLQNAMEYSKDIVNVLQIIMKVWIKRNQLRIYAMATMLNKGNVINLSVEVKLNSFYRFLSPKKKVFLYHDKDHTSGVVSLIILYCEKKRIKDMKKKSSRNSLFISVSLLKEILLLSPTNVVYCV